MFKTGEIERVIELFERPQLQRHLPYTGGALDKEPRENWKRDLFYSHGAVNDQFLTFLSGYSAGKSAAH